MSHSAQRIFREALSDPALRLRVVSNMSPSLPRKISRKQPPPVAPKPPVTERDDVGGLTPSKLMEAGVVASPGRGSPPPKPARLHDRQDIMHPTNTRKIGRKIRIQLLKGRGEVP
ncbi:PREDICTED: uncharacterized protein LOC106819892 [Priapulus caudatus]|uniref:Uncharacterized protein LOC106819892 n=1 Tax=Priapulus caudatus TaxID=37621 RepID=A0ABM1F682_PRICU|nr:PREDICTED: uncharacterized protein LOC106819892 [Priapulus caudatus]